jgi:DnaJ-class molecular chaperone
MQELKELIESLGVDPYELLGTDSSADPATLRKNYRTLAIKYHPDKNEE